MYPAGSEVIFETPLEKELGVYSAPNPPCLQFSFTFPPSFVPIFPFPFLVFFPSQIFRFFLKVTPANLRPKRGSKKKKNTFGPP